MNTYKELFDAYFVEVNNLTEILSKYVNAYRLLIGGAAELNNVALARKKDVKKALDRANQLGEIIDVLLDVLESAECAYLDYIRLKTDVIALKTEKKFILTEIDTDLLFQNSQRPGNDYNKDNDDKNCKGDKKKEKKKKRKKDKENNEDNEPIDPPYDADPFDEFLNEHDKD